MPHGEPGERVPRSDRSSGWAQGLPARPPGPRTGDPYVCPGCARTFAHKTFFDNHVSLCGTGNESEPEEEPEDEPPEDEPEEQPEEQPEDEPRIVPFYDQSDRSSLAVPSHEALGSISPSLQAEVAAVEKFVTEHCAEIIAGITHGEAPMYEPVRAHAEALRNLERTSCLLVVSTVPAVYNCFIAIELPAHLGGWRRPVRFGLWSQWLTWLGGICSVEESDSAGVAAHKRGWGIGGTVGGHGRGRGGALGPSLQARPPRRLASAGSIRLVVTVADLPPGLVLCTSVAGASVAQWEATAAAVRGRSARNYEPTGLGSGCRRGRWGVTGVKSVRGVGPVRRRAGAQAWLVRRIHVRTARQGWWWPTRLEITSQPVSAVGVGAVGGG
jgi:hypothetical protein